MNTLTKTLGLYIHIPFCDGKCNYCDFFSFKADAKMFEDYTNALIKKINFWSDKLSDKVVDTIYFGGGTPSVLGTKRLVRILNHIFNSFKIDSDCEITLEANPLSAQSINFTELKFAGFNRVSLGMQSAHNSELHLLGRRHNKNDVINTVKAIKTGGINNISLDVMLGIPEQTKESLTQTLDFCISLGASHISTYLLSIEPDTVFGRFPEKYKFADEDLQSDFYTLTSEYLKSKGFEHYEISNFCKDSLYSRHNMRYWQLKDYLGIGPSAHSLINSKRFYYPGNLDDFYNNVIIEDGEGNTKEEYIMLMLRTNTGINTEDYKNRFGEELNKSFFDKIMFYKKLGYVESDDNFVRLTEKGFLLSNSVIADLI